jgi:hypothetical protein
MRATRLAQSEAEWLTLMILIREVSCSDLGSDTGYPDSDFSWFISVLPGNCQDSALK